MILGAIYAIHSAGRPWQGPATHTVESDSTAPAAVVVTVQINVGEGELPPGAAELLANLRALTGSAIDSGTVHTGPIALPGTPVLPRQPRLPGSLVIQPHARAVWRDGTAVELTRREFDLLVFLCENPRRVFQRSQLLRQVWGYEPMSGDRTVDVHVRRLRIKLGVRTPVIATVRGVGYRLAEQAQVTIERDPY